MDQNETRLIGPHILNLVDLSALGNRLKVVLGRDFNRLGSIKDNLALIYDDDSSFIGFVVDDSVVCL